MRIVSKFKDYYDSAASFGVDMSQVFVRKSDTVDSHLAKSLYSDFFTKAPRKESRYWSRYYHSKEWSLQTELIGFCGSFYPLFNFTFCNKNDKAGVAVLTYQAFTMDDVISILEKHDKDFLGSEAWLTKDLESSVSKRRFLTTIEHSKNLFSDELFHKTKSPYWLVKQKERQGDRVNGLPVVLNPVLKDLSFQKIKNPYSAYQEINQFYFGVMTSHGNEIPYIEDKYMVQSKGFDTKYGFRKRPN